MLKNKLVLLALVVLAIVGAAAGYFLVGPGSGDGGYLRPGVYEDNTSYYNGGY